MNKFLRGFLSLVTAYLKIEIIGGLILVILVLIYAVFMSNHREIEPSIPDTSSTLQK